VRRAVLASSNPGKLRELAALLAPLSLELVTQGALGIEPAAETGHTFEANALLKARHAAQRAQLPALADDSGLAVDALGGRPGVWSARFAGAGASDEANLQLLLKELQHVPPPQRTAHYRCVIVFLRGPTDDAPLIAHGRWDGRIALAPRGAGGFGYDPVFVPEGSGLTAAELPTADKHAVSHRAQALNSLIAMLGAQGYIRAP
jgi:XTP/dITP diphosphohydrolase